MSTNSLGGVAAANSTVLFLVGTDWLALEPNDFQVALMKGKQLAAARGLMQAKTPEHTVGDGRVVDADEMESITGVPASWFLQMARERRIPHLKLGKYVRFNVPEVLEHCRAERKLNP